MAYYVSDSVEPADLRRKLTAELPSYMVPKQFVRLDQLPLSPNGKVDRGALRTQASLR